MLDLLPKLGCPPYYLSCSFLSWHSSQFVIRHVCVCVCCLCPLLPLEGKDCVCLFVSLSGTHCPTWCLAGSTCMMNSCWRATELTVIEHLLCARHSSKLSILNWGSNSIREKLLLQMKTPRKRGEATTQIQFFLQILFAHLSNTYCFSHLGYISEWNRENHSPQKSYYLSDSKWQARVQTLQWLGSLRAWSLLHTPPPRFRKECWGETITDISFWKPHLLNFRLFLHSTFNLFVFKFLLISQRKIICKTHLISRRIFFFFISPVPSSVKHRVILKHTFIEWMNEEQ